MNNVLVDAQKLIDKQYSEIAELEEKLKFAEAFICSVHRSNSYHQRKAKENSDG